jgi:hypothetical protein
LNLFLHNRFGAFDNRVLRRIFGPEREGPRSQERNSVSRELPNLYAAPNIRMV